MDTTIAPPPPSAPRPAAQARVLTGSRVVFAAEDANDAPEFRQPQYVDNYRAASEVFTEGGRAYVRIVAEADWYAWATSDDVDKPPSCPRARVWPAEFVWVE